MQPISASGPLLPSFAILWEKRRRFWRNATSRGSAAAVAWFSRYLPLAARGLAGLEPLTIAVQGPKTPESRNAPVIASVARLPVNLT
jgi:hypothetical protein